MRTILAVTRKELRQISRDRRTLLIMAFVPAFFLLVFGYALNFDVRHVGLAVDTEVKSPARPGQGALILEVRQEDDGGHTVVLQLKGGFANKRKPPAPAGTLAETGEELTYTTLNPTAMPSALPDEENTPWTHGGPPQPYEPTDEDAEETWE